MFDKPKFYQVVVGSSTNGTGRDPASGTTVAVRLKGFPSGQNGDRLHS